MESSFSDYFWGGRKRPADYISAVAAVVHTDQSARSIAAIDANTTCRGYHCHYLETVLSNTTVQKYLLRSCIAFALLLISRVGDAAPNLTTPGIFSPVVLPPENALNATQLAVIVNDRDPLSVAIGNYYQRARTIPDTNMIHVQFEPEKTTLDPDEFAVLQHQVNAKLSNSTQALALTWAAPYRVGCMSITSAFALGYSQRYCATGCQLTSTTPYFGTNSRRPFDDYKMRPTMMLAARNFNEAKALIDRGIAADKNIEAGAAYLIETRDQPRNARKIFFPATVTEFSLRLPVHSEHIDEVEHADDVMFYFTGAVKLNALKTNRYLPGAIADHLTSFGGQLTDSSQMSALRWLEAGATGSYGTVVEPCAFVQKFPNPNLVMRFYLDGQTLLEAYWKSVEMPGQGVFIGEPLARPYAAYRVNKEDGKWMIRGGALHAGIYQLLGSDKPDGPFKNVISSVEVSLFAQRIELPDPLLKYYRLRRISQ